MALCLYMLNPETIKLDCSSLGGLRAEPYDQTKRLKTHQNTNFAESWKSESCPGILQQLNCQTFRHLESIKPVANWSATKAIKLGTAQQGGRGGKGGGSTRMIMMR